MMKRSTTLVIFGFLAAPLASAILEGVLSLNPLAGMFVLLFAYPFALVLGIPTYFLFRWKGWLRAWQVILAGAFLGWVSAALISWPQALFIHTLKDLLWPGTLILHGSVVAAAFWWIAIRENLSA